MLITLLGIMTLVTLDNSYKALVPIFVTGFPSIWSGISTVASLPIYPEINTSPASLTVY